MSSSNPRGEFLRQASHDFVQGLVSSEPAVRDAQLDAFGSLNHVDADGVLTLVVAERLSRLVCAVDDVRRRLDAVGDLPAVDIEGLRATARETKWTLLERAIQLEQSIESFHRMLGDEGGHK